MLAPQSSETQLIPLVPRVTDRRDGLFAAAIYHVSKKIILTNEDNKLIVSGTLNHLVHLANILVLVSHLECLLMQQAFEALPTHAAVSGTVDGSIVCVHQHDLVVEAAPHQVVHLPVKVECLEVDSRGHIASFLA